MSTTVAKILEPYSQGKSIVTAQGRNLYDLELNSKGQIQPLIEILRNQALSKYNLVMVQYSRSTGVICDTSELNQNERNNVNKVLCDLGIKSNSGKQTTGDDEFVNILRSLLRLGQQSTQLTLRDNVPLKFLILIEYPEHLLPHLNNGTHTQEQIIAIELAFRLSNSLAFRKSQNYTVLAEARPGLIESLIYQNIDSVNLSQPCIDEKKDFILALSKRYPNAKNEGNLTDEIIANLSSGTPNRSLESIYLMSERIGKAFTAYDIFSRRQEDIIMLSEGTLEAVDHNRVKNIKVVGTTIEKPMQILMQIANGLKVGNKNIPRNIILCGSPSSGKTVLSLIAAANAGVPAFNLVSSKSQWVGESERRTRVMLNLLRQLGGLGIIDEIELQLPMNRNVSTSDSGVTQNLIGQLQSFLADTSLTGRVCLVGTSNRPHVISEAMRQRWTILPVLMPLQSDYPAIIISIAKELNLHFSIDKVNPKLIESSNRFYEKGVTPREIRESLIVTQGLLNKEIDIDNIEFSSFDIIPSSSKIDSIFSDYLALSYCKSNSFLPWWNESENKPDKNFDYPDYIKDILFEDNTIDKEKLNKKIRELEPYANV